MKKKLLLADDSVTIQKVVELILADEDYEVRSVGDGEEAWSIIKEYMPDIILADVEMPKMNGYQLCEKIKNDESTSHIPVILLAGAFEPIDEELARDVRADDYIVKPFESQELISKINAVLASQEMEEAVTVEETEAAEEAVEPLEAVDAAEEAEVAVSAEAVSVAEEEAVEVAAPVEETEFSGEEIEIGESEEEWDLEEEISFGEEAEEEGEAYEEGVAIEERSEEEEIQEDVEEVSAIQEQETAEEVAVAEETAEAEREVSEPAVQQPAFEISVPSTEEIASMIQKTIEQTVADAFGELAPDKVVGNLNSLMEEKFDNVLASLDLQSKITDMINNTLQPIIEKTVNEMVPKAVEEAVKTAIEEIGSSLRQQVERVVWETVPDLAETIITKEIEKIKSTF